MFMGGTNEEMIKMDGLGVDHVTYGLFVSSLVVPLSLSIEAKLIPKISAPDLLPIFLDISQYPLPHQPLHPLWSKCKSQSGRRSTRIRQGRGLRSVG